MKKIRLKQAENSVASKQPPEITPEHHRANIDLAVSLLTPIVEKSAVNPAPVSDSFDDLMKQFDNPKRSPVVVNRADGRRVQVSDSGEIVEVEKPSSGSSEATLHNSGGESENASAEATQTFTPEETAILDSLK